MPEWFDKFFDGLYGRVLAEQFTPDVSLKHARLVKRLLGARKGRSVLDIPCGQGRLTLPLARMGLKMTGVDRTRGFIRKAKSLARRKRLNVRFVVGDMRRIDFDGEFDAAFNWFTSIGYFSAKDELEFCRRVFRALKPGGRFLVETMNGTWLDAHFEPHRDESIIGGVRVKQFYRGHARDGRLRMVWQFRRGRKVERNVLVIRHYSGPELRRLLEKAGFREVRLFGRSPFGRLTRGSRRVIAVGIKPRS